MQKTCLAAGILAKGELLLDVDNNAGTHGAASPTKAPLSRDPFFFKCSAEVNSACAEIFAPQKCSDGASRRPICDGAPGGRTRKGQKKSPPNGGDFRKE